ncbi:hypothetical protein ACX9R5_10350 [Rathayibacter sp. CAU 1779]
MTTPNTFPPAADVPSTTLQQLQQTLALSLADTPYEVGLDPQHPDRITVAWKVTDQKWTTLFRTQSLSVDQGLNILVDQANRTYRLDDILVDRAFYGGANLSGLHLSGVKSVQRGRMVRYEAHKNLQWGVVKDPEGGLTVESSDFGTYTFSTETMRKAVIAALTAAGWTKRGLSTATKLGIVGVCIGGVAVLGGIAAAIVAVVVASGS